MAIFYDMFIRLCAKNGKSPASVAHDIGISSAAVNGWKNGTIPRDATLQRIADYFGVTVDYLRGTEAEDYYIDEATAEIAQEVFDNPDLRVLFDTARDASPEDIKTATTVLKALRRKDKDV